MEGITMVRHVEQLTQDRDKLSVDLADAYSEGDPLLPVGVVSIPGSSAGVKPAGPGEVVGGGCPSPSC